MTANNVAALLAYVAAPAVAIAAIGPDCENFFQEFDSAHHNGDGAAIVRLAADTVGKDCWSMGGGQGPTNAASLRLRALWMGADAIFDSGGLLRAEVASALGTQSTDAQKQIIGWLAVSPSNTPKMLSLLASPEPAARWVGIYKAQFVSTPPSVLVDALKNIALTDDDVMLVNVPPSQSESTTPADAIRREFVAPLRTAANERLAKWNEQLTIDQQDVARTGLRRLIDEHVAHPEHRNDIDWAVSRFTLGQSPIAEQALRTLTVDTADKQQVLSELRKAAKLY